MEGTRCIQIRPLIAYFYGSGIILLISIGTRIVCPQEQVWSEILQHAEGNHLIAAPPLNRSKIIILIITNCGTAILCHVRTQIMCLQLRTMPNGSLDTCTINSQLVNVLLIRLPIVCTQSQITVIWLVVKGKSICILTKGYILEAHTAPLTANLHGQLLAQLPLKPNTRINLGITTAATYIVWCLASTWAYWTIIPRHLWFIRPSRIESTIISILMVDLPFSANLPVIIYLIIGLQVYIVTVICIQVIITMVSAIFITNLAKTADFQLINKILHLVDGSSILLDLLLHLLQGLQLAGQLLTHTVNQGIVSKAAALVGVGNNLCHLITGHGLITLEGTIWITFQNAVLGQNLQRTVCPMPLRNIVKCSLAQCSTILGLSSQGSGSGYSHCQA